MDLLVKKRDRLGKASRALIGQGFVPAEVYGRGFENEHLAVSRMEFLKVFREAGENTIVNLVLGVDKLPALIHEVKRDYLTDDVSHIDFYRVTMTEKIKAKVPLEFVGEAPAVKEKLGILNRAASEIEVESLPGDLPHRIEVVLSVLDGLDKSIYARDLKVPLGVKILVEPETVIATVVPIKEEEVAPVTADVSAVKVEGEEKKAEREAKKVTEEKKE